MRGYRLIREVKSLDHLGHLPTLVSIHSDIGAKVKYAGGMRAFIEFGSSSLARDFMNNERKWKSIFNYLKPWDDVDQKFDRIACVRIVGLPISLWSVSNFSTIARKIGKIIVPFDHFAERNDLSVVKIGILTEEKKKINDVIKVEAAGMTFEVGVVEYEDELWFPFKFESEEQPYESDSDDKSGYATTLAETDDDDGALSEGEEGISDIWMDGVEEGEIVGNGKDMKESRN